MKLRLWSSRTLAFWTCALGMLVTLGYGLYGWLPPEHLWRIDHYCHFHVVSERSRIITWLVPEDADDDDIVDATVRDLRTGSVLHSLSTGISVSTLRNADFPSNPSRVTENLQWFAIYDRKAQKLRLASLVDGTERTADSPWPCADFLDVSPDGRLICLSAMDCDNTGIVLLDMITGERQVEIAGESPTCFFVDQGRCFVAEVSGKQTSTVKVWNIQAKKWVFEQSGLHLIPTVHNFFTGPLTVVESFGPGARRWQILDLRTLQWVIEGSANSTFNQIIQSPDARRFVLTYTD